MEDVGAKQVWPLSRARTIFQSIIVTTLLMSASVFQFISNPIFFSMHFTSLTPSLRLYSRPLGLLFFFDSYYGTLFLLFSLSCYIFIILRDDLNGFLRRMLPLTV